MLRVIGTGWPMKLYEILVPTMYGDTIKPIRTKHHKNWDEKVQKLTGGLTIFPPGKGIWVDKSVVYAEKVIPVRILCEEHVMLKVVNMTIEHYRQKCVMYYCLSAEAQIVWAPVDEPDSAWPSCRHGYANYKDCNSCYGTYDHCNGGLK